MFLINEVLVETFILEVRHFYNNVAMALVYLRQRVCIVKSLAMI